MKIVLACMLALGQDEKKPDLTGRVIGTAKDGDRLVLTLEVSPGKEAGVVVPESTRAAIGQYAAVWLQTGSKEIAAQVRLSAELPVERKKDVEKQAQRAGRVVKTAKDGPATLVTLAQEGREFTFKMTEKTEGEVPSEGAVVTVWLEPGSADVASAVKLRAGDKAQRKPDLVGEVAEVSKAEAGTKVVLKIARKEGETARASFVINKKTKQAYAGIDGEEGEQPTVGYAASVWLQEGSAELAALVKFDGNRKTRKPDLEGEVIGLSKEGDTIKVVLKEGTFVIAKKTRVAFSGDTRRPALGLSACVWFQEGSKDAAAEVRFSSGK